MCSAAAGATGVCVSACSPRRSGEPPKAEDRQQHEPVAKLVDARLLLVSVARMERKRNPGDGTFAPHCAGGPCGPCCVRPQTRSPPHWAFRGSITHPTRQLCTLRDPALPTATQHSLPGGVLSLTQAGLPPADRASFAWRTFVWPNCYVLIRLPARDATHAVPPSPTPAPEKRDNRRQAVGAQRFRCPLGVGYRSSFGTLLWPAKGNLCSIATDCARRASVATALSDRKADHALGLHHLGGPGTAGQRDKPPQSRCSCWLPAVPATVPVRSICPGRVVPA